MISHCCEESSLGTWRQHNVVILIFMILLLILLSASLPFLLPCLSSSRTHTHTHRSSVRWISRPPCWMQMTPSPSCISVPFTWRIQRGCTCAFLKRGSSNFKWVAHWSKNMEYMYFTVLIMVSSVMFIKRVLEAVWVLIFCQSELCLLFKVGDMYSINITCVHFFLKCIESIL